jgi:outer membrane protein assembly factor BamB
MQRDRGGDTVDEDESRYQVTVRLPGAKDTPDWTGEVVGPPALYPLKTVNVIAAGKSLTVLDKSNKKKWQAPLSYRVAEGAGALDEEHAPFGLGPCVERGDTLYIIDQGVLTAFDLEKGGARWRLPSVGITGLFFDDEGKIYVNSTTASPENIKYSRQIDVTEKTSAVILKLDPQKGTTLWVAEPGGQISHLSGRFIYTLQSFQPDDDEDNPYTPDTGFEALPYMKLKRINPKNGRVMWEYFQQRCPLDVQFEKNSIQLVFKKEVQVLKFLSF